MKKDVRKEDDEEDEGQASEGGFGKQVNDNSQTASDSSCFANAIGGTASFPGPLREPAVRLLWTF